MRYQYKSTHEGQTVIWTVKKIESERLPNGTYSFTGIVTCDRPDVLPDNLHGAIAPSMSLFTNGYKTGFRAEHPMQEPRIAARIYHETRTLWNCEDVGIATNADRDPVLILRLTDEVLAVMPTLPANEGFYVCYAHVGQHGECDPIYIRDNFVRAINPLVDDGAGAALFAELDGIYDGMLYPVYRFASAREVMNYLSALRAGENHA